MNKLTKAVIAAAAGTALLIGAGTTLAYWNDSVSAGNGAITAGDLAFVDADMTGTWQAQANGATAPVDINIADFRAVPGDTLTYTTTATIRASGDNLSFTVALTDGAIVAATPGNAADVALAEALANGVTYEVTTTAPDVTITDNSFTVTNVGATEQTYPITVTATIAWPFGTAGSDNAAKTGQVDLSQFAIAVNQIATP